MRVYKMTLVGHGSYFDPDLSNLLDNLRPELGEAEIGAELRIAVVEMRQADLDALPEFDGF